MEVRCSTLILRTTCNKVRKICAQVQVDVFEPKCFHQKQTDIRRSLVLEPGPGASIMPIWWNLISIFDLCSDARFEVQAGSICWKDPWHEIRHIWNQRVREMVEASHIKTWAENYVFLHWNFFCYIMGIPDDRWVRPMLHWQTFGTGPVGYPTMHWANKFEQFSRIKHWYDWRGAAANAEPWMIEVILCEILYEVAVSFVYTCFRIGSRPKEGCVFRMRTSDLRPQTS